MTPYKQGNYPDRLGTCNTTIASSGCFITSMASILDRDPREVNNILRDKGGYTDGCMVNQTKACELLGLKNDGKVTVDPKKMCIAETDYYKPTIPQHFFVWLGDGNIMDPIVGKVIPNKYRIVSYRLISRKDDGMRPSLYRQKGQGTVYFYAYGMVIGLANEADARVFGGDDWANNINEVDDIHKIGTPVEELINKPAQVITNTVTVEKPVVVEINELTDEEKAKVISEYEATHPPVVIEKVVSRDITVGEALTALWNAIKGISIKS